MKNVEEMKSQLTRLYSEWKNKFDRIGIETEAFSPPLLLSASSGYSDSDKRVIIIGQETYGWGWTKNPDDSDPDYVSGYTFSDQNSLTDFLNSEDSIEALVWGYQQFAFAKNHPLNRRSPFWRAFREISGSNEPIWSNVVKCDYQGGTILPLEQVQRAKFLDQQSALVSGEIDILEPDAVVFFTGPYYDWILKGIFPGIEFESVEGERFLARIKHPKLPDRSYRTYHPAYLNRVRLWGQIGMIREAINRPPA